MKLLVLIALPCFVAIFGQAIRGIRIAATAVSIAALVAEMAILRGIGPEDVFAFGTMTLSVSPLANLLLGLFIVLIGAIIVFNHGTRADELSAAALFVLGAVAAVLLLNNFLLITLLVEMIGVGIVLFAGGTRPSQAGVGAATRYLAAVIISFVCLVFAFLIIDLYRLSPENAVLTRLVFALVIIGFGIRLSGFPFHFWLPDFSHHSPPMVTALCISVLSLAVLAFMILVFSTFPWILAEQQGREALMAAGAVGAVLGAAIALGQPNINRVLAYSTVSDMGLIVFGLATITNLGLIGALFQAVTMAVGKLLLLMCAGTVLRCCGEIDLSKLGGLAQRLPVTAIGFIIGGLSVAGYPPFGGFASRWVLLNVAVKSQGMLAVWIVAVSAILLLAYARVFRKAFLGETAARRVSREPFLPSLVILGLSLAILAIGVFPSPLLEQIQIALAGITFAEAG